MGHQLAACIYAQEISCITALVYLTWLLFGYVSIKALNAKAAAKKITIYPTFCTITSFVVSSFLSPLILALSKSKIRACRHESAVDVSVSLFWWYICTKPDTWVSRSLLLDPDATPTQRIQSHTQSKYGNYIMYQTRFQQFELINWTRPVFSTRAYFICAFAYPKTLFSCESYEICLKKRYRI